MLLWVGSLFLVALLTGCGGSGGLQDVRASTGSMVPGSRGIGKPPGAIEVRYTLGSRADVSARLRGPVSGTLLAESQAPGAHVLRFNGVISASETLPDYSVVRKVVPAGDYSIELSAGGESRNVSFRVNHGSAVTGDPPSLANLVVRPDTISPNSDALDDVAQVTFRTEQTSTISVDLFGQNGVRTAVFAPQEKGPGEQSVTVNGQDLLGQTLPDGTYTVTVQLHDRSGNRSVAQRPLKIQGGGEPAVEVLKVEFSPQQITLGSTIEVSVTVKNVGNVPLRTQGPDRGYTYTTNDSYSSVEGGKYDAQAGLWRVGVDWDGNSGGAAYRYPFRWGFGKTLMPGETVVTGGKIKILKQERQMWFFAGVLQEGIRIVRDRLGITPINVSY
jgi:hypothetical protein